MKSLIFRVVLGSFMMVGLLTTIHPVVKADARDCAETKALCRSLGGTRSGDAFCAAVASACKL